MAIGPSLKRRGSRDIRDRYASALYCRPLNIRDDRALQNGTIDISTCPDFWPYFYLLLHFKKIKPYVQRWALAVVQYFIE